MTFALPPRFRPRLADGPLTQVATVSRITTAGGLKRRLLFDPQQSAKKPSREFRDQFGHTPVSLKEAIPWECKRLVIGTGVHGRLPIMAEVAAEARQRGVELVVCSTPEAVQLLRENPADTNAILHVTC